MVTSISKQSPDAPRYKRQLSLAGMNAEAQRKLFEAKVLIAGVGGAGATCAAYLADAGIGTLILVDTNTLQEEDLSAQTLMHKSDIGKARVDAAAERLLQLNESINVQPLKQSVTTHNAEKLIQTADIIVDCMSIWQDKLALSDACMQKSKVLVHAGIRGFDFHIYVMIPGRSACLRCLFADIGIEDVVSTANGEQGTLGAVEGMAGSFQAIEVIKLICSLGATPGNYLIRFDALRRYADQVMELGPRPDCPDCGRRF